MFNERAVFTALKSAFEHEFEGYNKDNRSIVQAYVLLGILKVALVAYASYSYLHNTHEFSVQNALSYYRKRKLLSLEDSKKISDSSFMMLSQSISLNISDKQLCELHQWLICVDVAIVDGKPTLGLSKKQRDAAGSYFTPESLAATTTQHALTLYERKYGFDHQGVLRVVDLSCGAGEFLIAALNYAAAEDISATLEIWAYDVDLSALLIAYTRTLRAYQLFFDSKESGGLENRFILGNPLIACSKIGAECTQEEKEQLFFQGLLYSEGMRLSEDSFPSSGFNILLGNPPWEKIRFEDRKYFDLLAPNIAAIPNKANRSSEIEKLSENDELGIVALYKARLDSYTWFKRNGRSVNTRSLNGEPNTYALFAQIAIERASERFIAAQIVKTALLSATINSKFFSSTLEGGSIVEAYLFSNKKKIFAIDGRERFCVLFLGVGKPGSMQVSFGNERSVNYNELETVRVTSGNLAILNPQTRTLLDLENNSEFSLMLDLQKKYTSFETEYPGCHFGRLVHLTTHAKYISHRQTKNARSILEGKFIGVHDSRYSTFEGIPESQRYKSKVRSRIQSDEEKCLKKPLARYFIEVEAWESISKHYTADFMLCWRSLTSSTNSRTMISSLCEFQPSCQSVQFLQCESEDDLSLLAGLFNSMPFEYIVRKKIPGIDLTQAVIRQMPVPPKAVYGKLLEFGDATATLTDHIVGRLKCLYIHDEAVLEMLARVSPLHQPTLSKTKALEDLDDLYFIAYDFSKEQVMAVRASFA
ncbi:MAG: hypothetical protein RR413_08935 [Christensenellaceae bacterium]